jgi:hypothetical protein
VRLEPSEVPALPLAAALVDLDGREVAATPEWPGRGPGTVTYHTGHGHLLVAPDVPTPELDGLVARLLDEVRAAAGDDDGAARCRSVLAAGLELVAGRPPEPASGRAEDVVALASAAIRARTQGLAVQVAGPLPSAPVPAPAAVALAIVQLAVNAQQHEGARGVVLSVAPGPTFSVEWPSARAAVAVRTHRHELRRERWGWGYVQMVADALGGVALPPGPAGPGMAGACLGLGAARLTLPLACVRDGRVQRATQAWDQDARMPAFGQPAAGRLTALAAAARERPGRIAYNDLYRARHDGDSTWVALAPESGSSRARDLLHGLGHERALWAAPEPHATRVLALGTLLQVAMGEPWPSVAPNDYAEGIRAASASLGIPLPPPLDALCLPDPRVTAFLLAELGGTLVQRGEEVHVATPPGTGAHPLLAPFRAAGTGWLRINA